MTITKEMYEYLYHAAKDVVEGEITFAEAKDEGIKIMKMAPASAAYYLQAVIGMLTGEGYTYTISNAALDHYLTNIRYDIPEHYSGAIEAAYMHYQSKKEQDVNLPGVLKLVRKHQENLLI